MKQGTGRIIDSPDDVGSYPKYRSDGAPLDSDNDGIPDAWETQHGLNPRKPDGRGRDLDPGYDNLEVYINSLLPIPANDASAN